MKANRCVGLLICIGALANCGENAERAAGGDPPAREWQAEATGRIGSIDDPDQSLTEVAQILIGPDEQFFVREDRSPRVLVYDREGSLVTSIGRSGSGPGEFTTVRSIGFRGDTLYAADSGLGRVSLFSLDGGFLRSTPWVTEMFSRPGVTYMPTTPQILLPDGSALAELSWAYPLPSSWRDPGVHRHTLRWPFFHVDRQSEALDTVAWAESNSTGVNLMSGGDLYSFSDPFDANPLYLMAPDGRGLLIVERSPAQTTEESAFTVTLVGPSRDTIFSEAIPYEPVAMTDERLDMAVTGARIFRPGLSPSDDDSGPGTAEMEAALRGADLIPATLIPVTALAAGQDGSVWLRREEIPGDSVLWQVLNREGRVEGVLRLPSRQTVIAAAGDVMAAVEVDELDIPYIVRYRLRRD